MHHHTCTTTTTQVDQELATYHDIIFVDQPTNYTTILIKTFFVFQYAVWNYRANFVLKTDDDAYVNVPATISMLRVCGRWGGC